MTTYTIGSGETYTTFAALFAAITLVPGDIVDGSGETYTETVSVPAGGTIGNLIVFQNAVIDAENIRQYCIRKNGKQYIKLKNITVKNTVYVTSNDFGIDGGTNWTLEDVIAENCRYGVGFASQQNITILRYYATSCETSLYLSGCSGTIKINGIDVSSAVTRGAFTYGVRFTGNCSGLLDLSNIRIEETAGGLRQGFAIDSGNYDNGSCITNLSVVGTFAASIQFNNCSNIAVVNLRSDHNTATGLTVMGSSHHLLFYKSTTIYNAVDGVNVNDTSHDIVFLGCQSHFNGYPTRANPLSDGDGFSDHSTTYNVYYLFCVAMHNWNTGFAHIDQSAGMMLHCAAVQNGDPTYALERAGVMILTSGDNPASIENKSWKIKYCIVEKNYPKDLLFSVAAMGSSYFDIDNNMYFPYNDIVFASINGGYSDLSISEYLSLYEPGATTHVETLVINGEIPDKTPCYEMKAILKGLTMDQYIDAWSKGLYKKDIYRIVLD